MRNIKKGPLDIKKFMDEVKANRTNRSYTSLDTKSKPIIDSKFDTQKPIGNLYSNSFCQFNERQPFLTNSYQQSRRNYEQSQRAIYNYVPFPSPNDYVINQPSSFIRNHSSQNFMGNSAYYMIQNSNPLFQQSQSFQMGPINQMRQPIPQYIDNSHINNLGVNHSQVSMDSLRKQKDHETNTKQIQNPINVPGHKITESLVIQIGERPEPPTKSQKQLTLPIPVETTIQAKTQKKKAAKNKKNKKHTIDTSTVVIKTDRQVQIFQKADCEIQVCPQNSKGTIQVSESGQKLDVHQRICKNFNSHLEATLQACIDRKKYAHFKQKSAQILEKLHENFDQPPSFQPSVQYFGDLLLSKMQ